LQAGAVFMRAVVSAPPRGGYPARQWRLTHATLAGQPHRRGKRVFAVYD
jgi:hypothetical protein